MSLSSDCGSVAHAAAVWSNRASTCPTVERRRRGTNVIGLSRPTLDRVRNACAGEASRLWPDWLTARSAHAHGAHPCPSTCNAYAHILRAVNDMCRVGGPAVSHLVAKRLVSVVERRCHWVVVVTVRACELRVHELRFGVEALRLFPLSELHVGQTFMRCCRDGHV